MQIVMLAQPTSTKPAHVRNTSDVLNERTRLSHHKPGNALAEKSFVRRKTGFQETVFPAQALKSRKNLHKCSHLKPWYYRRRPSMTSSNSVFTEILTCTPP